VTRLLAAPLFLLACAAAAQDYPKLKPGQWELTINTRSQGQAPPTKSTMCIDEALQREMATMGAGMSREMCSKNDFRRDGNKFIGNAECKLGESKMISRSTMTLTGDTAYHTEVVSTYDPPFMGMKDSRTLLDGKYAGPCANGLVPGDFIAPNGQKFNMKAMAQGRPPAMPSTAPTQPKAAK
jgi:hypothetical protein